MPCEHNRIMLFLNIFPPLFLFLSSHLFIFCHLGAWGRQIAALSAQDFDVWVCVGVCAAPVCVCVCERLSDDRAVPTRAAPFVPNSGGTALPAAPWYPANIHTLPVSWNGYPPQTYSMKGVFKKMTKVTRTRSVLSNQSLCCSLLLFLLQLLFTPAG